MKKKKKSVIIRSCIIVLLIAVTVFGNIAAYTWDGALNRLLGVVGGTGNTAVTSGTVYYETGYNSQEELIRAQREFTERASSESVVLLKNDGALPLKGTESISLFGLSSAGTVTVGSGSGSSDLDENCTWENSFKNVGFQVNEKLVDFYRNSGHKHGAGSTSRDWTIDEVPLSEYTKEVTDTYADYSDAAIMVVGRTGGENGDLARDMSEYNGTADRNYLSLSAEEEELLKSLKEDGFEKVILVVNSAYPMELGAVDQEEYGVDACIWVGNTGVNGLDAIGKIFTGEYNPSGRIVDTYWYDNMDAPSMKNMGDLTIYDENGNPTAIKYVTYAEGIYVGYRYTETRYADMVMGTENAGEFHYNDIVKYPFGYGMSYTEFEWSNYQVSEPDENGDITVSVDVTNIGDAAGKDVVEVYYQAPYTDYDKENGIEKSAVALAGYAKTNELDANGGSETVTITFNLYDMTSYATGVDNGTYILDAGDYYITAGRDAHNAVNNILAYQGYTTENGMTEEGNTELVSVYTQSETDTTTYKTTKNGVEIVNRFEDADINYYMPDTVSYLSRQNWSVLDGDDLRVGVLDSEGNQYLTANKELIDSFNMTGYEASGAPDLSSRNDSGKEGYTYDAENGVSLIDLKGLDYDDPAWDTLLDEIKLSDESTLFGKSGYGNDAITKINKPQTYEYDGPASISNFITGSHAFSFPSETTLAATWNVGLLNEFGILAGCDAINSQTSGWYAPGANIHRTPFDGRNFEYFSEDPILSATMCVSEIEGVQSKGVYVYVKHLALNDQETNRNDICTFANEQSIREIYLKVFEHAVVDGGARGVMTSFNRIGTRNAEGHYNLISKVLREEWGFQGVCITDYKGMLDAQKVDQYLAAGNDMILCTTKNELTDSKENWCRAELRRAAHNILYVQANSLAMNGLETGMEISSGIAVYKLLLWGFDIILGIIVILLGVSAVKRARMTEEQFAMIQPMSKKKKRIIWITAGVCIVVLAVVFYIFVLPLNLKAAGVVV